MPVTNQMPPDSIIAQALSQAIKTIADRIFEEHKKAAIAEFEDRKEEILAGIVLSMTKRIEIDSLATKMVITLDTRKP